MSIEDEIERNISAIKGFTPGAPLKNYISYIVFPRFKNLEPGTRIDFTFPVAALVGANGIGKTSVLHALWGAPFGYSTSRFWFETDLDPISGVGSDTQRFFYGHWSSSYKGVVETRKNRVYRRDRAKEYWEPARIRAGDGMQPLPAGEFEGKSKDRWNPVQREVLYLNLKAVFGGFDRYFYFDEEKDNDDRSKIRRATRHLRKIKTNDLQKYIYYKKDRVFENRRLNKSELYWVSKILGRKYENAHVVRHAMYPGVKGQDFTVIFKRGNEYSEAFAGSGELSVVRLVVDLLQASEFALVLLDEPETSLHPGAQRQLLNFILEQVKLKKVQVVLSTHSPDLVEGLPDSAIHAFDDFGQTTTRVLSGVSANVAFNRLGKVQPNVARVLVEDDLAKLIVLRAIESLDPGERDALEVLIAPGGAAAMLMHVGPAALVSEDNIYFLLDGDQKKVGEIQRSGEIPPNAYSKLDDMFRDQIGVCPSLNIPGGEAVAHRQVKIETQLRYLDWLRDRLHYLPGKTPEGLLLTAKGQPPEADDSAEAVKTKYLKMLAGGAEIELSASDVQSLSKVVVAQIDPKDDVLKDVVQTLKKVLAKK